MLGQPHVNVNVKQIVTAQRHSPIQLPLLDKITSYFDDVKLSI